MKIKEGFLLRQIAGQTVVLPTAGDLNLNIMITLNETGTFLWEQMQQETSEAELTDALLEEYDVEEAVAKESVAAFVKKLREHKFLT